MLFIIFSNASSGISFKDPKKGLLAALQTKISICPYFSLVFSTRFSNELLSDILHGITKASPIPSLQSSLISAAVCSQTSTFLEDIDTLAPCRAIAVAIDFPIPFDEPVMTATLLSKLNIFSP